MSSCDGRTKDDVALHPKDKEVIVVLDQIFFASTLLVLGSSCKNTYFQITKS